MLTGGDKSKCRSCGRGSWWSREEGQLVCRACGKPRPVSRMWMYAVSAALISLGGVLWAID